MAWPYPLAEADLMAAMKWAAVFVDRERPTVGGPQREDLPLPGPDEGNHSEEGCWSEVPSVRFPHPTAIESTQWSPP